MIYPDYCYIDVAFGGARNRNNIIHVDELDVPKKASHCYTSMFRFKKEYYDLVEETGSVRGANNFLCWSDFLWFDIDADEIKDAWQSTRKLLLVLQSMKVLKDTVIFYSGSKGFHVGIPSAIFELKPAVNLPTIMREIAETIATAADIEIDTVIYQHNRLWRIPNSIHRKTGNRKIQIAPKEFDL